MALESEEKTNAYFALIYSETEGISSSKLTQPNSLASDCWKSWGTLGMVCAFPNNLGL